MVDLSICVVSRHISNYHHARFAAADERFRDFTAITLSQRADFDEFLSKESPTYRHIQLNPTNASGSAKFKQLKVRLLDLIKQLKPDVVAVSGWASVESVAAISACLKTEVPLVMMSASQKLDSERSFLREIPKRMIVNACQSGLVGGDTQKEYLMSLGMSEDVIFRGYNVVDNDHFQTAKSDYDDRFKNCGFICSARFIEKKNIERLLQAYKQYTTAVQSKPKPLLIIGDGERRGNYERLIHELDLKDLVSMPGFKSYEEIPHELDRAYALVLPSTHEQWGLVVNEAAAAGLPVLVSNNCGAARHLVNGNGYRFDPFSVSEIAKSLLMISKLSAAQYRDFSERSRELVQAYAPSAFGEGLARAASVAMREKPRTWLQGTLSDRILNLVGKVEPNDVT